MQSVKLCIIHVKQGRTLANHVTLALFILVLKVYPIKMTLLIRKQYFKRRHDPVAPDLDSPVLKRVARSARLVSRCRRSLARSTGVCMGCDPICHVDDLGYLHPSKLGRYVVGANDMVDVVDGHNIHA